MTKQTDIFMPEIIEGIHEGAIESIKQARRTGTNLVIWRDGKIIEITPEEAEQMLEKREREMSKQ